MGYVYLKLKPPCAAHRSPPQEWMECMVRIGAALYRRETNNGSVARALSRFMAEVSPCEKAKEKHVGKGSCFCDKHLTTKVL